SNAASPHWQWWMKPAHCAASSICMICGERKCCNTDFGSVELSDFESQSRSDLAAEGQPVTDIEELGFSIFPVLLSNQEIDHRLPRLSCFGNRTRAGKRHLLHDPAVTGLASDPRLLNIAREALGARALAFRATLFEKSTAANWLVVWHQDVALP